MTTPEARRWRDAEPEQFAAAILAAAEQLGVLPLAQVGEKSVFAERRPLGDYVEAEVPPLELTLAEYAHSAKVIGSVIPIVSSSPARHLNNIDIQDGLGGRHPLAPVVEGKVRGEDFEGRESSPTRKPVPEPGTRSAPSRP